MSTPFLGEIRLFAFSRVPAGWLACDGSQQPISQYDALFALLGTTFGGDGVNTFAMPDMRGQVPLHQGNGGGLTPRLLGEVGGSEAVTLLPGGLPAHNHSYAVNSTLASATVPAAGLQLGEAAAAKMYATSITGLTPFVMSTASTSTVGGSQPHDNTMPTLAASFCIACEGIFPQQQ